MDTNAHYVNFLNSAKYAFYVDEHEKNVKERPFGDELTMQVLSEMYETTRIRQDWGTRFDVDQLCAVIERHYRYVDSFNARMGNPSMFPVTVVALEVPTMNVALKVT
ncbi:MAG: hypothetical protein SGARI_001086 [Bacillariaceae sp.]